MKYKRYIYYGGARETKVDGSVRSIGVNDNSAFQFAAKNIAKTYSAFQGSVLVFKIDTARHIVDEINNQQDNSIKSLDIISHGSPLSLNFSKKPYENCGFCTSWLGKQAISHYYSDDDGDYKFSVDARKVSEIEYKKFTENARIQLHGCLTASDWFRSENGKKIFPILVDNVAAEMSELLYAAGKKQGVVIGHTTRGNPNINGPSTTISQQDYRHGSRVVYNNGNVLLETRQKGYLQDELIASKFK